MSKQVDERVVEMRFDNSNFESNVKTSMSTLDKLKQSLNFKDTGKSLEGLNSSIKGVNMNPLSQGVDTVKAKFSALDVVAVTALANITNSAVDAGKKLVKSLTLDQVTEGFSKYEAKTASVQTIMNATGKSIDEVSGYLDKLMWYSDETSYGFDDMAKALATMTSSGGNIDNLIPMIEGVANATAFAGKGAAEFSRIMEYGINQAYSLGYMQVQDWKSIESATVNSKQLQEALIAAGEALGKIKKGEVTLSNFRNSLKDAWLDTEVMEAGFGKFAELTEAAYEAIDAGKYETASEAIAALADQYSEVGVTAFKSAQEAKTFTEAIEATKDAVSSSFMRMAETVFGNYEQAKTLWTELTNGLYDVFAAPLTEFEETLSGALNSKWDTFKSTIEDAGISVESFQGKLSETLQQSGVSLDDLIKKYGSLEGAITSGEISTSSIIQTLKAFGESVLDTSTKTEDAASKFEEMKKLVHEIAIDGSWGVYTDRWNRLTEAGYDAMEVQKLVNKFVWEGSISIDDLSDSMLKNVGYTEEEIAAFRELAAEAEKTGTPLNELIANLTKPSGRELLIDTIRNALKNLVTIINSVKKAWNNIFGTVTSSGLYKAIESIHNLSEKLVISEENAERLTRTFSGLFAILDLVKQVVSGVLNGAFQILSSLFSGLGINIFEVTAKIGDAIVAFRNWVTEHEIINNIIQVFVNIITACIGKVKEWITAFLEAEKVQTFLTKFGEIAGEVFEKIKEFLEDFGENAGKVFEKVKEYVGDAIEKFEEFITYVKGLDGLTFENVQKAAGKFVSGIVEYFTDFEGRFSGIQSVFDSFGGFFKKTINDAVNSPLRGSTETLETWKDKILSTFGTVGEKIKENIGLGEILTMILGGSLVVTMSKAGTIATKVSKSILGALSSLTGGLTNIFNSISGAFTTVGTSIAKYFNTLTTAVKVNSVLKIAGAIAILAGSLWLIAQIPEEDLKRAGIALAGLAVGIGVLAFAMDKLNGGFSISKEGASGSFTTLLALAAALAILVHALKEIQKLGATDIAKGLFVIALLLVELSAASILISKKAPKMTEGATAIIAIAVAIRVLAGAIKTIGKLSLGEIAKGLIGLAGAIVGMVFLTKAASKLVDWKAGIGIFAIAASVKMMASAIDSIANLELDKAKNNIEAFIIVFASIIGLMYLTQKAGKYAWSGGVGILAMSSAILILCVAIRMISSMNRADLNKAVDAISQLFIIFGLVVALSKFAGKYAMQAGVMLLAMSFAMILIAGIIVVLSHIDHAGLDKAVDAISQVMIIFGLVVALSGLAAKAKLGPLIGISITLGVLLVALGALSMIPAENLKAAAKAMSLVMGVFAIVLAASHLVTGSIGPLIVMTVAIGLIGGVLIAMDKLKCDSALDNAKALSLVLLAMAAAMAILNKSGAGGLDRANILKILGTLAVLELALVGIGAILLGMSYMENEYGLKTSLETAASLSLVLLAMAGVCKIMSTGSLSPTSIAKAAIAGAALGAFIDALVLVVGAFAFILGILSDKYVKKIERGAEVMKKVGMAIGNFYGGIAAGAMETMADKLPGIGEKLSDFAENIKPFLETMKGITEDSTKGIKNLSAFLLSLTASEFIDAMTQYITGDQSLSTFADGIKKLGESIKVYGEAVAGIGEYSTDIEKSIEAAQALSDLEGTLPGILGVVQYLTGQQSLAVLGLELPYLGDGLKKYSDSITGDNAIDTDKIKASAEAAQGLADLESSLPGILGVVQALTGQQSLAVLGVELPFLGMGLKAYSDSITGDNAIDTDKIKASAEAAQGLATLESSLPGILGVAQKLTGQKSLVVLAAELPYLGKGLKAYSDSITGDNKIDTEAISASADAAQKLADLENSLPGILGVAQMLTGQKSLATFGTELALFGKGLVAYSTAITAEGALDCEAIKNSVDAAQKLADLEGSLEGLLGVVQFFTGHKSLALFGTELALFGKGLVAYSTAITAEGGLEYTAIENSITAAQKLADLEGSLDKIGGIISWFEGENDLGTFGDSLTTFGNCLRTYGDVVSEVKSEEVTKSITYAEDLSDFLIGTLDKDYSGVDEFKAAVKAFSKAMKDISTDLSEFQGEQVTTAVTNMETLSTTMAAFGSNDYSGIANFKQAIEDLGSVSLEKLASSFSGAATQVVASVTSVLTQITTSISNYGSQFGTVGMDCGAKFGAGLRVGVTLSTTTALTSVRQFVSSIQSYTSQFGTAGMNCGAQFGVGLRSGITISSTTALTSINQIVSSIQNYSSKFQTAGSHSMIYFANGLRGSASIAYAAVTQVLNLCTTALSNGYRKFYDIGANMSQGLADGIRSKLAVAQAAASELAATAAAAAAAAALVQSPSRVFMKIGAYMSEGLAIGIAKSSGQASDASTGMANGVLDAFKQVLKINSPSLVMNEMGHYVVEGLAEGIEKDMTAEKAMAKKAENIVSAFKTKLDELDLDTELSEALQSLWEAQNPNADVTSKFNQEKATLEEQLKILQEKQKVAEDEYAETIRVVGENTEDAQKAQIKMVKAQTAVLEMQSKINNLAKSYVEQYSESTTSTTETVNKATESQNNYAQAIVDTTKAIEAGLITQAQGNQYLLDKYGMINGQFVETAKTNGKDYVKNFVVSADQSSIMLHKEGEILAGAFDEGFTSRLSDCEDASINIIDSSEQPVEDSMPDWSSLGTQVVTNFAESILNGTSVVTGAVNSVISAALSAAQSGVSSTLSSTSSSNYSYVNKTGSGGKIYDVDPMVITTMKVNQAYGTNIGSSLTQGMAAGISQGISTVNNAITKGVTTVINTAKSFLGINSPSKVFMEFGRFVDEGFAIGIRDSAKTAIESARTMAQRVADVVNNESDIQPHITPVLDLGRANADNTRLTSNLTATLTAPVESWSKRINDAQAQINASNESLKSEVRQLREDLNTVANSYEKETNLYVDSKKLASSIVRPMNRELNILSKRGAY